MEGDVPSLSHPFLNHARKHVIRSEVAMLTVKEVSQALKLSLAKCYGLIQSGKLECYRHGRSVRVSEAQLDAYLEQVKSKAKTFTPSSFRHF